MSERIRLVPAILALAAFCLTPSSLIRGQESRGTLIGRVTDPSGAVLPNVRVELVNLASGVVAAAETNTEGNYRVPFLTVGDYRVSFTANGFQKLIREKIEVRIAEVRMLDVSLQIGAQTQEITVTAEAPALETATASLGQVIDRQRLDQLPFREGNPHEMVKLAPGVVTSTHLRLAKPGMTGGLSLVSVDGGTQARNDFSLDGVVNTAGTNVAYSPPAASVEEVKVETAKYDASTGFTAGGVVNVVTRSGSNQYHGEGTFNYRNSRFDNKDFFQTLNKQPKAKYTDKRFDGALGGPIIRDRMHFHTAVEINPYTLPYSTSASYPTAKMRGGDLTELNNLGTIYDPLTGRPDPANPSRVLRDPFPTRNVLPANRINPTTQKLIKLFPEPNAPGTGTNFFHPNAVERQDWKTINTRVDYAFSERHRAYARYSWAQWIYKDPDFHLNDVSSGNSIDRSVNAISIDDTYTLSASTFLNARFGYTAQRDLAESFSAGVNLADYGLAAFGKLLPETASPVLPMVNIAGWTTGYRQQIGEGDNYDRKDEVYSWQAGVHHLRGNHTLNGGGEYRWYRNSQYNYAIPTLDFGSTWGVGPYNNSPTAGQLHGLAAFLMGFPGAGSMTVQPAPRTSTPRTAFYLQDDWRVSRRLMLNFGVRHELDFATKEAQNQVVNAFDLKTTLPIQDAVRANYAPVAIPEVPVDSLFIRGGLLYAGVNGQRAGLWNTRRANFMPRAGFTFQANSKTVLHGGFGRFYDTLGITRTTVNSYQTGYSMSTSMRTTYDSVLPRVDVLTNPYPDGLLQPTGSASGLMTNAGGTIQIPYAADAKTPYTDRFSFGIRRELPLGFMVESAYLGNRGSNLIATAHDLNAVPIQYLSKSLTYDQPTISFLTGQIKNPFYGVLPRGVALGGATNLARQQFLRAYPAYSSVMQQETVGKSWYDAMQMRVERRMANGVTVNVAYTLSKALAQTRYRDQSELAPEKTFYQFDRTHVLNVNSIAQLPFGRGRLVGKNWAAPVNAVLGNWQVSAMYRLETGFPIGMPNYVLKPGFTMADLKLEHQSWDRVFNTDIFNRTSSAQPASNVRYYSSYAGNVRSNDFELLDISLMKTFRFGERLAVDLRASGYNMLDSANLMGLNVTPTSASFGKYTSVNGYGRHYQFAIKAAF